MTLIRREARWGAEPRWIAFLVETECTMPPEPVEAVLLLLSAGRSIVSLHMAAPYTVATSIIRSYTRVLREDSSN